MVENKVIEWLKAISATQKNSLHESSLAERKEALHIAIKAISEIQRYKEIEKSVIETLEKYVECAEQKVAEYDEKGETLSMLVWEIEAKAYQNAIEIVKEAAANMELESLYESGESGKQQGKKGLRE